MDVSQPGPLCTIGLTSMTPTVMKAWIRDPAASPTTSVSHAMYLSNTWPVVATIEKQSKPVGISQPGGTAGTDSSGTLPTATAVRESPEVEGPLDHLGRPDVEQDDQPQRSEHGEGQGHESEERRKGRVPAGRW